MGVHRRFGAIDTLNICKALEIPHVIKMAPFIDNRKRLENAKALDEVLQDAIGQLPLDELTRRFIAVDAPIAPVNDIAQIYADPQFQARENIVAPDEELGGPVKMQILVGKFSATPGKIKRAGPKLGEHNRDILITELGFSEAEVKAAGIELAKSRTT